MSLCTLPGLMANFIKASGIGHHLRKCRIDCVTVPDVRAGTDRGLNALRESLWR